MKKTEEKNEKNSRPDEPLYDISDMGDAPLLAVLEADTADDDPATASPAHSAPKEAKETDTKETGTSKEAKKADTKEPGTSKEAKKAETEDTETSKEAKEAETKEAKETENSTPGGESDPSGESQISLATKLLRLASSLIAGDTTPDDLLSLLDAAKAYEEIQRARHEGEIAGRNAIIEEKLAPAPIGVPDLNGAPARNTPPASIFDLAKSARP